MNENALDAFEFEAPALMWTNYSEQIYDRVIKGDVRTVTSFINSNFEEVVPKMLHNLRNNS